MEHNFEPDGKQEEQESIMITNANTIIDPWAVMVKSLNTLITYGAMSRSRRSNHLALWTEICWVDISQQLKESFIFLWFQNTCIFAGGCHEGQENQHESTKVSDLEIQNGVVMNCWKSDQ